MDFSRNGARRIVIERGSVNQNGFNNIPHPCIDTYTTSIQYKHLNQFKYYQHIGVPLSS